jgi:hypothetical protein
LSKKQNTFDIALVDIVKVLLKRYNVSEKSGNVIDD